MTESDWQMLANTALDNMNLEIARKALIRTKDWILLELIQRYTRSTTVQNKSTEMVFLADVMAYRGYFAEAAKLYRQSRNDDKAVAMYTDLRMFEQAQEYMSSDTNNKSQLNKKRAEWIQTSNEPKAAVQMYLASGDTVRAIEIIGQHIGQHDWAEMSVY